MNDTPRTQDELVATALLKLEVPDHRPGFDERLRRRLAEERALRRAERRLGPRMALAGAVAAVAALALGIRAGENGADSASAAEVKARVQAAVSSAATMQGRLVAIAADPLTGERNTRSWVFAMTSEGDLRLDELDGPGRLAYDAERGIERQLNTSASMGTGLFAAERTGLAPGAPDPAPTEWLLGRDLGSVVRALLAARDPRIGEIRYEGREAWQVDVNVPPNAIYADADRLAITVDEATGIPVHVVETLDGAFRRELRVEGLRLGSALPADAFTLRFPRGIEVFRTESGFRRTSLPRAAEAVGYAPLVPHWVPAGYGLSEVAVARRAQPTGREGSNPPSEGVVSLSYRRGFDHLVVSTRLARTGQPWSDPLATGEGFVDDPEPLRIRTGALSGAEAQLLIAPRAIPHVWALTDSLVVTVSGDLSRSELIRVAESLGRRL
jgi:hypothetical protein